jgi:stage III sporulation protein AD
MEGARIGGLALVGLVALLVLRQYKPEWAVFIRMAVTVVSMGIILSMAGTVITYVTDLTEGTGALDGATWSLLLKALGIAFLTETAASICRDSGEASLAGWVEMAGKLEILLLAFPLIRTVLDTVAALLGRG